MKTSIRVGLAFQHVAWLLFVTGLPIGLACGSILYLNSMGHAIALQHPVLIISVCAISNACMVILYSWCFTRPVLQRIRSVSTAAKQLASGTYDINLHDTSNDELTDIAKTIMQLANSAELQQSQMSRENQSLNHQATHDDLTGLSNRKHGNETISKLDKNDSEEPVSILFLDLDGFKAVNDTCGHAVGDEILVAVSLRLKATLRDNCELIRWGGDEFVIVMPSADQREAISVAQDVAGLFKYPIATSDGVHKLGCSIGMSTSRTNTSLEEVLQEADADMYMQKRKRHSQQKDKHDTESLQWPGSDYGKAA